MNLLKFQVEVSETQYIFLVFPVDGSWGSWGKFGACSTTCGGGTMERKRFCDNPPPDHGGDMCRGSDKEIHQCQNDPCKSGGLGTPYVTLKLQILAIAKYLYLRNQTFGHEILI